jgi:endoglucanase
MRRQRGIWIAIVGVTLLVAAGVVVIATQADPAPDNPFSGATLYTYPESSAATAASLTSDADEAAAFAEIASVPTAVWLLPEAHPTGAIAEFVTQIGTDAAARSELPVFVVYGIPSRDCGNFSAGGIDANEYPMWISAIARGLATTKAIVILEPDAIALSPSCNTQDETASLLQDAISRLSVSSATTIYLDGGHSAWLEPRDMARLLVAAGVDRVRGFATNVSNYNSTDDEREYGEAMSALLGGSHFVVDTSRNGSGSTGEWCNPPGRSLGDTPSGVDDGSRQDANLWIKNPGESDGECNGGPPAGQWWPSQALELARGGA